ncbi:unnamed protein product [Linum trigynum]|uniref:Uncharacterized protein n=1 Tax=Linum trigynum TaxID=586398 RepID=A0AAV2FDM3_9ROSI
MKFRPTTGGMLRKDKMGEKGQAGDTERTSCRYYDGLKKGTWSTETFSITIITTTSSVMRKVCRLSSKVKGR